MALVLACIAAPLWADKVAETTMNANHLSDMIKVDGKEKNVVGLDGVPIGPQWLKADGKFFLGADRNGRDIMVRLLYGGRNSLLIGVVAALHHDRAVDRPRAGLGLLPGPDGHRRQSPARRDVVVPRDHPRRRARRGVRAGRPQDRPDQHLAGDSLVIPIFIIGMVYVPYMARPVRGQVLSLREKEFVEAARAQGAGPIRIMFTEMMPNLASTVIVFFTLLIANAILLEAALSFLGAGVQPPNPSWGTMIDEGVDRIATAPHLTIVPGLMLVLTVLALNVFGDGVRDALDPRAKVRLER